MVMQAGNELRILQGAYILVKIIVKANYIL